MSHLPPVIDANAGNVCPVDEFKRLKSYCWGQFAHGEKIQTRTSSPFSPREFSSCGCLIFYSNRHIVFYVIVNMYFYTLI